MLLFSVFFFYFSTLLANNVWCLSAMNALVTWRNLLCMLRLWLWRMTILYATLTKPSCNTKCHGLKQLQLSQLGQPWCAFTSRAIKDIYLRKQCFKVHSWASSVAMFSAIICPGKELLTFSIELQVTLSRGYRQSRLPQLWVRPIPVGKRGFAPSPVVPHGNYDGIDRRGTMASWYYVVMVS